MRIIFILLFIALSMSACSDKNKYSVSSEVKCDSIGPFCYFVKDTISRLYISHHECTECLDAWLDSGQLFISENIHKELIDIYNQRGADFLPNGRDLHLIGKEKIYEKLFGDSINFMDLWHNRYFITGKAVNISRGDGGIVFRVDSYKKL